ncbi:arsenate reductase (glutaredoxin) [Luteimonas sp. e5]
MRYYHNPRCSKSRQALELLRERGIEPELVSYLQDAPDEATLRALIGKLGITPRELLRRGEDAYSTLDLGNPATSDDAIIAAMLQHPILIERPIFEHGERAVIGRPPERVLDLL